jgi:hypothetical protein
MQPPEASVIERALSLLARLEDLIAPRREPIAIPVRRDDRRMPRQGDRCH